MRNISLRDLKLADTLKHMSEVEMINPKNDEAVKAVLAQIGFDTRQPIQYIPSYHRDMQNKTAVGFQAVGEYAIDPKFNKYIDTTDRIVIVGMQDPSFAKEMLEIHGKKFTYNNEDEPDFKTRKRPNDPRYYSEEELIEMGYTDGESDGSDKEFYDGYGGVEPMYDVHTSQIQALIAIRDSVRDEK